MVDTNVLISALIYGGRPERVVEHVLSSQTLILSDYIVNEVASFLRAARPKLPQKWLRDLRKYLQRYCRDYPDIPSIEIRDPADAPIIALALEHHAIIITGDRDLLDYTGAIPPILSTGDYEMLFLDR